jgi:predicted nucleic acid-binding protein
VATYLADKSALVQMRRNERVAARLSPWIVDGEVATCGVVELEVLYSARNSNEFRDIRDGRRTAFPRVAMSEADFIRAEEVLGELSLHGQHRGVSLPDLLIAAAAERTRLIVLHYDADYDTIAKVTGQVTEWVAPRGTL